MDTMDDIVINSLGEFMKEDATELNCTIFVNKIKHVTVKFDIGRINNVIEKKNFFDLFLNN